MKKTVKHISLVALSAMVGLALYNASIKDNENYKNYNPPTNQTEICINHIVKTQRFEPPYCKGLEEDSEILAPYFQEYPNIETL